jgi:hypothetical protein
MKDLAPHEEQALHEKMFGTKFVPLADRIMNAHSELSSAPGIGPGTPIGISELRSRFSQIPQKTLDAAILGLGQAGKLDLIPSDAVSPSETAGLLGGKYVAARKPVAQAPPDVGPIPF